MQRDVFTLKEITEGVRSMINSREEQLSDGEVF